MTKRLWLFFVFYFLVGQPAILWWIQNNGDFYLLALLNACVFFIAWIISAITSSSKDENVKELIASTWKDLAENTDKKVEKDVEILDNKSESIKSALNDVKEDGEEEKKSEEEKSEKTLRENVSIPKIVQPLWWNSWRSATKRKWKKESRYGQWIVMLLTLLFAWFMSYTLWEFLENWGIAIALFLGWILYLIIWKLFDVNGFYAARKLFTNWLYILLILGWIWYGIYATQQEGLSSFLPQDWADKISSYTSNLFGSDQESNVEDGSWAIYIFEWTWEVIASSEDGLESLENTWNEENEILNDSTNTWILENPEVEVNVQPEVAVQPEVVAAQPEVKVEEQATTSDDPNREITMGEAVKHLLQWYTLSTKNDKAFTYVAKSNELYPYFKTAQEKAMIWFDTNPNKRISCETYMSLKWILEWWSVNIYDRSQTRNIYWNKANELGKTNWCAKWTYVKVKNL